MTPRDVENSDATSTFSVGASRHAPVIGWLALALLVLVEYGLFRQFAEREITWAPPMMHDQVGYLASSYAYYETFLVLGPAQGVWLVLQMPTANGIMLSLQGSLLYLVLGPSRLTALTLNFIYFVVLQLTLAGTLRWLTRSWGAAFLGVGLALLVHAPFCVAGGLMDFRIDFIALCLYGTVLSLAIRSNLFLSWKWSAACGAAAGLLGLFRFISTVYLGALGGAFCLALLVRLCFQRRSVEGRRRTMQRLVGLGIVGAILIGSCGPLLLYNRKPIHDYYVVGHVMGSEKDVRKSEVGIVSTADALMYYPRSFYQDHTGPLFWYVGATLLAVGAVLALGHRIIRPTPLAAMHERRVGLPAAFTGLTLAFLLPLLILTSDTAKSPVVGGILVGPAVWLVALTVIALLGLDRGPVSGARCWMTTALATGVLCSGVSVQLANLVSHSPLTKSRADYEHACEMLDQIVKECRAAGWVSPRIASTNFNPAVNAEMAGVFSYEKQGIFLQPQNIMPRSVLAIEEDQAARTIGRSDFVIFTRSGPGGPLCYPFVQSMQTLRPQLLRLCERSFVPVGHYHIFSEEVTLYKRPCVRVEGAEPDGWITDRGLAFRGACAELRSFPHVELSGNSFMTVLPHCPKVQARLITASPPESLVFPAALTSAGDTYSIKIDLDPASLPRAGEAEIQLDFDTWFVPKDANPDSCDTRRLVILKPNSVMLTP